MRFRPCIDIHNGSVKQIVGGSLKDNKDSAEENYVSKSGADFYAKMYKKSGISGGHIIILNHKDSRYYEADVEQAKKALGVYHGGFQIGGGINSENAEDFLEMGASHVIVTSHVFKDGRIYFENLEGLVKAVGRERLVLDLSCRKRNGKYYIVTDRWQSFTDVVIDNRTLDMLSEFCDEYLIHAVDVEGKASGIEKELAACLGEWGGKPVTYAGGVSSFDDLDCLKRLGRGRLDVTIGSALDIFGGSMPYQDVLEYFKN